MKLHFKPGRRARSSKKPTVTAPALKSFQDPTFLKCTRSSRAQKKINKGTATGVAKRYDPHSKLYMRAQLSHRYFRLVWSENGNLRNESMAWGYLTSRCG